MLVVALLRSVFFFSSIVFTFNCCQSITSFMCILRSCYEDDQVDVKARLQSALFPQSKFLCTIQPTIYFEKNVLLEYSHVFLLQPKLMHGVGLYYLNKYTSVQYCVRDNQEIQNLHATYIAHYTFFYGNYSKIFDTSSVSLYEDLHI